MKSSRFFLSVSINLWVFLHVSCEKRRKKNGNLTRSVLCKKNIITHTLNKKHTYHLVLNLEDLLVLKMKIRYSHLFVFNQGNKYTCVCFVLDLNTCFEKVRVFLKFFLERMRRKWLRIEIVFSSRMTDK